MVKLPPPLRHIKSTGDPSAVNTLVNPSSIGCISSQTSLVVFALLSESVISPSAGQSAIGVTIIGLTTKVVSLESLAVSEWLT